MSVALPERSWSPHKVLLVMPDLQIFIISPPDNLIMQRCRIHFSPLREPVRDALFPDYFPALPAALYKPTRTPSIMLFSPFLLSPQSWKLESCNVPFCLALLHGYNNRKDSPPGNTRSRQQPTFLFKRETPCWLCYLTEYPFTGSAVKEGKQCKLKLEVLIPFYFFLFFLISLFFSFLLLHLFFYSLIIMKWRGKNFPELFLHGFFFFSF